MKDFKNLIVNVIGLIILCIFGFLTFCNANDFIKQYNFNGSASSFSCTENCFCATDYSNSPGQGDFEVFVVNNKGLSIKGIKYECDTPGRGTYYITGENNFNFNIPNNYGYCKVSVIFDGQISSFSGCPDVIITYSSSCPECETCPEVDTGAILSGYIAIDDITDNYCISNGLCGEISTGMSTLYINDIRHESKPFIYVNIPEEFDWDYTGNVAEINIDVKGYNTDSDYIAGIISSQISKPTSDDLGNLINVVAKFVPGLVIILFIYFIFRFIKKIF